jgi:hypothetical protein
MMKISRTVLVVSLALFSIGAAFSEEDPPLLNYYDSELIKINMGAGIGLFLSLDGAISRVGFGISPSIQTALSRFPDSDKLLQRYGSMNKNGNICLWSGLAVVLGGAGYSQYLMLDAQKHSFGSPEVLISMACMLAGLAVEIGGTVMISASYEDLINAVNAFNRDRMREYGK